MGISAEIKRGIRLDSEAERSIWSACAGSWWHFHIDHTDATTQSKRIFVFDPVALQSIVIKDQEVYEETDQFLT